MQIIISIKTFNQNSTNFNGVFLPFFLSFTLKITAPDSKFTIKTKKYAS